MIWLGMVFVAAVLMSVSAGASHAKMTMQTFPVLAGAGPHDVYPAPDGTVWFTAQSAGKLGRLDPRTGKSDLIALGPGAAPHGVIVGPDGAPGSPKAGRTRSPGSTPRRATRSSFRCPRSGGTPISTRRVLIARACSGSPGRMASMAGSIPKPA
jgi:virginiamycin B lyase